MGYDESLVMRGSAPPTLSFFFLLNRKMCANSDQQQSLSSLDPIQSSSFMLRVFFPAFIS